MQHDRATRFNGPGVKPLRRGRTLITQVKPRPARAMQGPFEVVPAAQNKQRNDKRREKYANGGTYKEMLQAKSRVNYRKSNKMELSSCLRSLSFYATLAKSKSVTYENHEYMFPVMNIRSVADCLGKIYQTIWRWSRNDMIPKAVLMTRSRSTGYYHVDEVRVLIEEIGNHERTMAYYRSNHREVRERIFSRIENVRQQWS
jgi:hypothetical protein